MSHTLRWVLILAASFFAVSNAKANILNGVKQSIRNFPDGFMFGAATASYQIEGAWDADGKSENIWDRLTHSIPCRIKDCSNGDVAADSYNRHTRDVEMMRELGLDHYRFSLSWSRILPTSFPDVINDAGVQYYNNLINAMLKYNIEPMVTLYHWDLPQKLQEMGGWTNPHVVDWFADYARVAFELFGDRVKYWMTMNEPHEICNAGYGGMGKAPQLNFKGLADYMCAKNLLVAHAKAYHIYNDEFKPKHGGVVGMAISAGWAEPESEEHVEASNEALLFGIGQYAHPIYTKEGDFPQIMKEKVAVKSAAQGYYRSRLIEFTPEELDMVRGSADFFGLNHYTSSIVYRSNVTLANNEDSDVSSYQPSSWPTSASSWLKQVPWGFHKLLNYIRDTYDNPVVIITENGFSTLGGLEDDERISYYREYLNAMLDAIEEGCNVAGYTAWSLMDNFEWLEGYTERFGLYEVDFTSANRTRTPRKSAFVYKEIVRSRALDPLYEPNTNVMTIDEGH
ncbi:unnamed protein product [Chilo suppressalis]|uniref:beta-glucosidase n=1 Tax=Chilo suppressalis TaxID=168631 RepID=A0ABN8B6B9_CHISP|nr:unnamed protein product [Chilo suppressalis]